MNSKFQVSLMLAAALLLSGCSKGERLQREIHSEEDLSGLVVSTSAGNYFDDKYSPREDITLFRVNTESDGIQAMRQGIADVHVTDEVAFPADARERLHIKLAFRGVESFDVAFALRKGDTALAEEMNRFPLATGFWELSQSCHCGDIVSSGRFPFAKGRRAPHSPVAARTLLVSAASPLRQDSGRRLNPVPAGI